MEAAAEKVKLLTRSVLPEKPHQLSKDLDWLAPTRLEDDKKPYEEWSSRRLQYMTLVSEADRGVLFTRGYYDLRPEPVQPALGHMNALARSGGEKKKLSLSDYKNKKSGAPTSDSPPEANSATYQKRLAEPGSAAAFSDAKASFQSRSPREPRKTEPTKLSHVESGGSSRPKPANQENNIDMRLPPKPPKTSLPARPPSPESRKRVAENDDGSRPPKRPKPAEAGRPNDGKSQPRDDTPRRKLLDPSTSRDSVPAKESPGLPNGRSILRTAMAQGRNSSPPTRDRNSSVNGIRPNAADSNRNTPGTAPNSTSKSSVPPLLSPLRLSDDYEREQDGMARKPERRKLADGDVSRPGKSKNSDPPQASKNRKPKVLPLLSPTLPAEVEAELDLLNQKRTSPKSSEDASKDERDTTSSSKRRPDHQDDNASGRIRKVVTIKIPKRARQTVKRILALSTSRKEPLRPDRPPSSSGTAGTPQATKRPSAPSEVPDTIAVKRPRPAELPGSSRQPVPPSTPSKKAQPMSRVSSSNSMAHTPGDTVTVTPSVPGSSDRLANGPEPPSKADRAKIQTLRDREQALRALGKRLKHNGDTTMKPRVEANAATNGSARTSESNMKLGYVLLLESTLSFMLSFHAQDIYRGLQSKPCEHGSWLTVFPLLDYLQNNMRRYDSRKYYPIFALSLVLQGVSYAELLKSYSTHDKNASAVVTVDALLKHERNRSKAWSQLQDANKNIGSRLQAVVYPWTTVEEAAETVLRVLRQWCDDEALEWRAELNLREVGLKSLGQG